MILTLFFFFFSSLKISITAILSYWRSDTPSFTTLRSRLATAPDTPMCIVIHGGQFTCGVHPPNQFVPEIVSPLPCLAALVRHTLLIVYFFKELLSFIGSLNKCHTSILKALIFSVVFIESESLKTFIDYSKNDFKCDQLYISTEGIPMMTTYNFVVNSREGCCQNKNR